MATRRRDNAPVKEKGISASQTRNTKLRGTPNHPSKTNDSTASQKQIPNYLRPTSRNTSTNVSKQQGKKPASTETANKPTQSRTRSLDKTLTPTQKTRVSTSSSLRSSLFSGKTIASQKLVPGRNLKAPTMDAGKHRLLNATPMSTVRKSSTSIKKQEIGSSTTSATKEEISCSPHEKVENILSISCVPQPETQSQDQECFIAEAEERTVQVFVGNNEKGTDDLVPEEQESLDIGKTEAESDNKDAKIVTAESSTVLEHQDTPLDIKIQESEDKSYIDQELEECIMNEISSINKGEILAGNPNEEAGEEEVKEAEVVEEEQEIALSKKDEAASGSEAHEFKETAVKEIVEEKKKESENAAPKQQERVHGKKDSAVSNDVIEETASKLREQRKNKVKALAGAFETVISLQETK